MKFSDAPGMRERQLIRRYRNPLFKMNEVTLIDLHNAQQEDAKEVEEFMKQFRVLVQKAVDLDENADPDVILKLKEQLDQSYEKCAGLAGDQSEIKEMSNRLVKAIMQVIWKGIGNDQMARSKLEMEEQARSSHYALLEYKIISDIIRPDSIIEESDLVATLMSEQIEALEVALQLFQPEQQAIICKTAGEALNQLDKQSPQFSDFQNKLILIKNMLKAGNEMPV
ncbi:MAG: hypothetical protein OQK76_13455 [Gammaproteobacteria bacterium]|nr:hypothetical protein [Gammaproteobacteria bacterium]MCW8911614.1 hypothetical protein [Gammaproteobacteria bacterium]MCW9004272.1 hypothetical protein [Gammaproteobacteria bacterium]MCW9055562.1 hypothetical protein [Gammaproteobacteria bacterium]